ncbi:MAG: hypothetical protein ACRDJN_13400 [Chloroflexota bacterium]
MNCTVSDTLLAEAREVLGTATAEETIEASLRESIEARRTELPRRIETDADLQQFLRDVRRPRTEAELARRRVDGEAMDRLRVKVGRDFNVAEIIREARDRAAAELPDDGHDER